MNDLNLTVTVGGVAYIGNVFSGASSTTGGSADFRNNVESVFVPAGVTGTVVVRVTAANLAADAVPGSGGATDQDFALVVYNASPSSPTPAVVVTDASLVSESCAPGNGAVDPNEPVTMSFSVQNTGTTSTTNVVATLLPTGGVTSPSGPKTYGALAPLGVPVAQSFSFTPSAACGQTVTATFQLQDGATNLGTASVAIPTGALVPTAISYTGPAVAIPDNAPAGVDVNLPVAGLTGTIGKVTFSFDRNPNGSCSAGVGDTNVGLEHTWVGDLVVKLKSPLGTTVTLVSQPNGGTNNGNNFCGTVLDDAVSSSIRAITSAGAPFVGVFSPEESLSAFKGENPNGTWVLNVADLATGDTGSVRRFTLSVSTSQCCMATPAVPIAATTSSVVSESCSPGDLAVEPGAQVTVSLCAKNTGATPTTNLVGTLQATGGVTMPGPAQSYGAVAPGVTVCKSFDFTAGSVPCGTAIVATLAFQDGANNLGTGSYSFSTGAFAAGTLTQSFDSVTAPALPAGWTALNLVQQMGDALWVTSSSTP
ncbi:MAG TPA: proprotein convertase P-domain-containing protein, partial [Thermoanaerobaculia bacterium]|nr:proprotein convertase P-domain-containing protein [Thermoanaerobaculia bacterium]